MAKDQGRKARKADDAENEQDDETMQDSGSDDHGGGTDAAATITNELKQVIRQAAIDVLGPAAKQATTSAAKYAVKKGPDLMSKNVMPAVEKAGGPAGLVSKGGEALSGAGGVGGMAGKVMSKLGGGGGGGDASGWGRNRRMPVQQWIYVSVSPRHAYNGWTEYKQWPQYMHRANQVDPQVDDEAVHIKVTEKMWGFTRPFTAEVLTQRPDEQIKWQSTEGTKHTGVINFHELGPRLTLIELNLDHSPSGPVEKLARGARFVKRAVRADFHRFQAWIEMKSDDELEELEGWRGTIEDGQVVKAHEDAIQEDGEQRDDDREQARGARDEEPEGEYDAEPEAEEEPEDEAEEEPEDEGEEDEEPRRRRREPQRKRPARRPQRARR